MKMRILTISVRLVLCVLIAGAATAFIDGWISHPSGGIDRGLSSEDPSAPSQTALSSVTAEQVHSALEGCLASPASAGDLNGDVQGD